MKLYWIFAVTISLASATNQKQLDLTNLRNHNLLATGRSEQVPSETALLQSFLTGYANAQALPIYDNHHHQAVQQVVPVEGTVPVFPVQQQIVPQHQHQFLIQQPLFQQVPIPVPTVDVEPVLSAEPLRLRQHAHVEPHHFLSHGHHHVKAYQEPLHLPPKVSKSVFVFSAPPDPFEEVKPRQVHHRVPIPRQKHYQVVFINAPEPPPPQEHKVELPPAPELKTLVYVLVKKPLPNPPLKIRAPPPVPQSRPEVFFIRYKGKGHGHGPEFAHEPLLHPGHTDIAPAHGSLIDHSPVHVGGPVHAPLHLSHPGEFQQFQVGLDPGAGILPGPEAAYGLPGGALGVPLGPSELSFAPVRRSAKRKSLQVPTPSKFKKSLLSRVIIKKNLDVGSAEKVELDAGMSGI